MSNGLAPADVLPETVRTPRLSLDLIGPAEAAAMVRGERGPSYHPDFPRPDDVSAASLVAATPEAERSWGTRRLVRLNDGLVFGTIGFYGAPRPSADDVPEVEVGYGLVEDARGHGVATEALAGLLELTDAAGVRVRAAVAPENAASLRVLAKSGFTGLRGANEDGELVMVRPLPDTAPARTAATAAPTMTAPATAAPTTGGPALPRLVATDLDGTLLHTDGTVTARTREVLEALDERGVPVVFVTGRPVRWMEKLWARVGNHGLAVCSNGGIVYDVAEHRVRNALTIDTDTAIRVAQVLRRAIPGTTFALEKVEGFAREQTFLPRNQAPSDIPIGSLEEICDQTVVKLLARHEEITPEPFWHQVEELVGDLVTTTWSSTGTLVEMSARGVTKASTLERIAAEHDVPAEDVVAFGDMPNDIPMLQWAGHSYAMENAHASVAAVARYGAPRNDEDGVAETLARLFGL